MERTETPTSGRLAELRSEGKVPVSPGATRCLVAAGTLLGAALTGGRWSTLLGEYRTLTLLPSTDPLVLLRDNTVMNATAAILVYPMAGALIGWFISWLGQARCLFYPAAIRIDGARVVPHFRFLSVFNCLLIILASVGAGVMSLVSGLGEWLKIVTIDGRYTALILPAYGRTFLFAIALALLGLAFVLAILGRYQFLRSNRMTRAEVAADQR